MLKKKEKGEPGLVSCLLPWSIEPGGEDNTQTGHYGEEAEPREPCLSLLLSSAADTGLAS